MMGHSEEYVPLTTGEDEEAAVSTPLQRRNAPSVNRILLVVCALQSVALAVLGWIAWKQSVPGYGPRERSLLFSPALEAIEHETKVFTSGLVETGTNTRWQGTTPDVDAAWQELYNNTLLRIPKAQAAMLPNRTYPIYGDEGYYVGGLDVFHQLHCLNMIRMTVYHDSYPSQMFELKDNHISHCIDSIRQSLMCNPDLSVNVWQWNATQAAVVGHGTQVHSCRSFDRIRDWAHASAMVEPLDRSIYVEDDLVFEHGTY
ncbi:hypothetical protein CYLTODRAFT_379255 [Cylindrobasidium torrendii FP15055 ss-10]|uniref:Tat pathway signal sequence n=1 Tax=Cylindrobasidium torrendii FP15055 ss-10 TaxID=1314674 RepID=A0A0D7B5P9_9AGAR|nr:hypothetical protein CYLTODRAFT_379255 [Cylindrobasidium torrendii FP15055 ss-10]